MSRKGRLKGLNNILHTKPKRHRNLPKESRVYKLMFTHLKATECLFT